MKYLADLTKDQGRNAGILTRSKPLGSIGAWRSYYLRLIISAPYVFHSLMDSLSISQLGICKISSAQQLMRQCGFQLELIFVGYFHGGPTVCLSSRAGSFISQACVTISPAASAVFLDNVRCTMSSYSVYVSL